MLHVWVLGAGLVPLLAGVASAEISRSGNVIRPHQREVFPFYISKSDCETDDDTFTFTFTVKPADGSRRLEVWASDTSDCLTNMDRNGASPKCKKVAEVQSVTTVQPSFKLTSRQIALALPSIEYDAATGECTDLTGTTAPRKVNLTFMLLKSPNDEASEYVKFPDKTYDIAVDLVAPPPPSAVTVETSERALSVSIKVDSKPTDLQKYNIYCDPPPSSSADSSGGCGCTNIGDTGGGGTAGTTTTGTTTTATSPPPPPGGAGGTGGAAGGTGGTAGTGGTGGMGGASATGGAVGAGGTAGTGGAGATSGAGGDECVSDLTAPSGDNPGSCVSCVLEGRPSDLYLCGTIPENSTQGTAAVLENGTYYAVGVAAVDKLGNVGELAPVDCGSPIEVKDFYEAYREQGGQAGGGCSVQRGGPPVRAAGPLAGALVGLAFVLRRRRRARGASPAAGGDR